MDKPTCRCIDTVCTNTCTQIYDVTYIGIYGLVCRQQCWHVLSQGPMCRVAAPRWTPTHQLPSPLQVSWQVTFPLNVHQHDNTSRLLYANSFCAWSHLACRLCLSCTDINDTLIAYSFCAWSHSACRFCLSCTDHWLHVTLALWATSQTVSQGLAPASLCTL